jgi:hypothetical protein
MPTADVRIRQLYEHRLGPRPSPGILPGQQHFIHPAKDYRSMERLILPLARDGRAVDLLLAVPVYRRAAA